MKLKRFVIMKSNGQYIATVYAERLHRHSEPANSSTEASGGHFMIGQFIVGSFEFSKDVQLLGEDGNCGETTIEACHLAKPGEELGNFAALVSAASQAA